MLRLAFSRGRAVQTAWPTLHRRWSGAVSTLDASARPFASVPAACDDHAYIGRSGTLGETAGRQMARIQEELRVDGLQIKFAVFEDARCGEAAVRATDELGALDGKGVPLSDKAAAPSEKDSRQADSATDAWWGPPVVMLLLAGGLFWLWCIAFLEVVGLFILHPWYPKFPGPSK